MLEDMLRLSYARPWLARLVPVLCRGRGSTGRWTAILTDLRLLDFKYEGTHCRLAGWRLIMTAYGLLTEVLLLHDSVSSSFLHE